MDKTKKRDAFIKPSLRCRSASDGTNTPQISTRRLGGLIFLHDFQDLATQRRRRVGDYHVMQTTFVHVPEKPSYRP